MPFVEAVEGGERDDPCAPDGCDEVNIGSTATANEMINY